MAPQPRIIPREISGQRRGACGQRASASCQIVGWGVAWQRVSMCSIDSVTPHVVQNSRCSALSRCRQYVPTFWVPCIALYMNCRTVILRCRRRVLRAGLRRTDLLSETPSHTHSHGRGKEMILHVNEAHTGSKICLESLGKNSRVQRCTGSVGSTTATLAL